MGNVNMSATRMSGSSPRGSGGGSRGIRETSTAGTRGGGSLWGNAQWQTSNLPKSGDTKGSTWDERVIGEMMIQGIIAPRARGLEAGIYECPICFLYYSAINASTCCYQPICTDCYLKVRPPRSEVVDCPFCSHENFSATVGAAQKSTRVREQVLPSKPIGIKQNNDPAHAFDDAGSAPTSPKTPVQPTIVSSIEEREHLQEAMRKQLEEARRRGDTAPPVPVSAPGGSRIFAPSRRRYRPRLASDGSLPLRDLRTLLHSLPTDLHQVEELMILEAMQASIQDEERRQRQLAQEENQQAEAAIATESDSTTVTATSQDRQTLGHNENTSEDPRVRHDSDPRPDDHDDNDNAEEEEEEEATLFPPDPPSSDQR